jgi:CHAD domain-containing protein
MPPRTHSEEVLRKRLRALARALPAAAEGDADAVHKARVASRRVREALPVLLAEAASKGRRRVRRQVERITRALGPVRELDVSAALVEELAREIGATDPSLSLLRSDIERERSIKRDRLVAKLQHVNARRLQQRAERLWSDAAARVPLWELSAAAVLIVRLTRRVDDLEAAADTAGPLYGGDPIHQVRIAVKKLRYAFELARDLRLLRSRRVLDELRGMQETLGRLNDLQVLVRRAEALRASLPRLRAEALTALVATLETRCREQHARYLARRERLLRGVDLALADAAARTSELTEVTGDRITAR